MKECCSAGQLPVIEIKDLSVTYQARGNRQPDRLAVKNLRLSVRSGEVFGFLGPNGAGKTTTMNVLLGFVNATSGNAFLFGTNVREPIARQRIGYLPELTYYYKFLSAEELLRHAGRTGRKIRRGPLLHGTLEEVFRRSGKGPGEDRRCSTRTFSIQIADFGQPTKG